MSENTKDPSPEDTIDEPAGQMLDRTIDTSLAAPTGDAAEDAGEDTVDEPVEAADDDAGGARAEDTAEEFDALGAAAELDAILSAEAPAEKVEQVGESYTDILESELAEMTAQVEERDRQLKAAEEEQEKARARIENEAERKLEQRSRKILCGFLEVLDDLDRALGAARATDHNPAVIDGIELVRKSFMQKLASFGVTHDPSMGEVFDPNLHDAMSVMSVADDDQDGKVVAVIREGYYIGEETLRPAGVVVGKKSS